MKIALTVTLAIALSACDQTPNFVRFERGERIRADISLSESDKCVVLIVLEQRGYAARMTRCGTEGAQ